MSDKMVIDETVWFPLHGRGLGFPLILYASDFIVIAINEEAHE